MAEALHKTVPVSFYIKKTEKWPLRASLNPAENTCSPQKVIHSGVVSPVCFTLFCCLFPSLSISLYMCKVQTSSLHSSFREFGRQGLVDARGKGKGGGNLGEQHWGGPGGRKWPFSSPVL